MSLSSVYTSTIDAPLLPASITRRKTRSVFLMLLGSSMATGSLVLIEPAPIDFMIMGLIGLAVLGNNLCFRREHKTPVLLLMGFLLANVVSLTTAVDSARALWYFAVTVYLALGMLFFTGVVSRLGLPAVDTIMRGYLVAGLLSATLGIAAYFRLIPYGDLLLLNGRVKGLFKDPNVYGPYLVVGAVYCFAAIQDTRELWARFRWGSVFLITIAGIFLSFSRACWLNCGVSIAGLLVLTTLQSASISDALRRARAMVLALVLIGCIIAVASNIPEVSSMLTVRLGQSGLQSYDQMRFQTHERALDAAIEQPLGIGPGQSEIVFQYAAHSLYLRVFSENGVLGAIAFFALCSLTVLRSTRAGFAAVDPRWRRLFHVCAACLAGLLLNSFVIDSVHWRHFWFLLGIGWSSSPHLRAHDAKGGIWTYGFSS